jgi:protein-S-isoprenylcysteine O-methyltransferase Ste14
MAARYDPVTTNNETDTTTQSDASKAAEDARETFRDNMEQIFQQLIDAATEIPPVVFVPAGSLRYFEGWLFMGLLFIPMFFLGIILYIKAPELLAKRLNDKEDEDEQKKVVGLSAVMFLAGFVLCGLDFRFSWSSVPFAAVIIASVVLLAGYGMYMEVMRENAYLSRTVEVQENQKVVDTGLYGIVRHPMYFATILMFISIPLVLGSWIGFVIFLIYPFLMIKRINNEEEILKEGLDGYSEYMQKVCYRMIPFIW